MTAARVTREAVDGLLDHAAAQARTLDELRSVIWWATDIILEVRDIIRRYDLTLPDEERLLAAVEHYVQTCPAIDPDLHRLPLPLRMPPESPGKDYSDGWVCGDPYSGIGCPVPGCTHNPPNYPHDANMPARPTTPGDGACGEAAPSLGPAVDVVVDDDISHAFDDLRVTEEEDGR